MKTLILFASKSGTTRRAAEMLARMLPDSTLCDLSGAVPSLEGYDCVALGGSVRMGRWHKLACRYAARHAEELLSRRVGLFVCSADPDRARETLARQLPDALMQAAVAVDSFGGEIVPENLHGLEKMIVSMVAKQENNPFHAEGIRQERILSFAQALLGGQAE